MDSCYRYCSSFVPDNSGIYSFLQVPQGFLFPGYLTFDSDLLVHKLPQTFHDIVFIEVFDMLEYPKLQILTHFSAQRNIVYPQVVQSMQFEIILDNEIVYFCHSTWFYDLFVF